MFYLTGAREAFLHPGDPVVAVRCDAQRAALPLGREDGRGRRPHQGHKHHRGCRKPRGERTGMNWLSTVYYPTFQTRTVKPTCWEDLDKSEIKSHINMILLSSRIRATYFQESFCLQDLPQTLPF